MDSEYEDSVVDVCEACQDEGPVFLFTHFDGRSFYFCETCLDVANEETDNGYVYTPDVLDNEDYYGEDEETDEEDEEPCEFVLNNTQRPREEDFFAEEIEMLKLNGTFDVFMRTD